MPELPDVEVFKKYLNATSLHKKITNVNLRDSSLLGGISSGGLSRKLNNQEFVSARRHGKYLFAKTDNQASLILHFGMTGFLKYFKDKDEMPSHARLVLTFKNDYHLAYDCQRKLGRIDMTDDEEDFISSQKLGPDPYSENFNKKKFMERFRSKRGSIKSTLMNQNTLAGIGNIYSDEILFQAGIHPKAAVNKLKEDSLSDIYRSMKKVLKTAIDKKVQVSDFPKSYLIRHRSEGDSCPKCTGKIKKIKISNRSTYFCSKHQKMQ